MSNFNKSSFEKMKDSKKSQYQEMKARKKSLYDKLQDKRIRKIVGSVNDDVKLGGKKVVSVVDVKQLVDDKKSERREEAVVEVEKLQKIGFSDKDIEVYNKLDEKGKENFKKIKESLFKLEENGKKKVNAQAVVDDIVINGAKLSSEITKYNPNNIPKNQDKKQKEPVSEKNDNNSKVETGKEKKTGPDFSKFTPYEGMKLQDLTMMLENAYSKGNKDLVEQIEKQGKKIDKNFSVETYVLGNYPESERNEKDKRKKSEKVESQKFEDLIKNKEEAEKIKKLEKEIKRNNSGLKGYIRKVLDLPKGEKIIMGGLVAAIIGVAGTGSYLINDILEENNVTIGFDYDKSDTIKNDRIGVEKNTTVNKTTPVAKNQVVKEGVVTSIDARATKSVKKGVKNEVVQNIKQSGDVINNDQVEYQKRVSKSELWKKHFDEEMKKVKKNSFGKVNAADVRIALERSYRDAFRKNILTSQDRVKIWNAFSNHFHKVTGDWTPAKMAWNYQIDYSKFKNFSASEFKHSYTIGVQAYKNYLNRYKK